MNMLARSQNVFLLFGADLKVHSRSIIVVLASAILACVNISTPRAAEGKSLTGNPQCPVLPTYLARLADNIPDLGGPIFSEDNAPVEPLGSAECPASSATQCERLAYLGFMFDLLEMSPSKFRRPGISAFIANISSEDASMGGKCSAEVVAYSAKNIRDNFVPSLNRFFCSSGGVGHATGQAANIIASEGICDISDTALSRLKSAIVNENAGLSARPGYLSGYAPIVARIYRYKNNGASDEAGYLFRGRGFIQITGQPNYKQCQDDIVLARDFLSKNPKLSKSITSSMKVNWNTLDIIRTPEAVSQNQFVAAFCAASYWKNRVAKDELNWLDKDVSFAKIVRAINSDPKKIADRKPSFDKWCGVLKCDKNYPVGLNLEAAFSNFQNLIVQGSAK